MLSPKGVDISNNPWISQVKKSIIDSDVNSGGGVEDSKLCIFDSCSEEVCDRVGISVERDRVKGGILGSSPLDVYSISYAVITDVLGNFFLIGFIDKNQGVVLRIGCVILNPVPTRVVRFLIFAICN